MQKNNTIYDLKKISDLLLYNYIIASSSHFNETVNITFYLSDKINHFNVNSINLKFLQSQKVIISSSLNNISFTIAKLGFSSHMVNVNINQAFFFIRSIVKNYSTTVKKILISSTHSFAFKLDLKNFSNYYDTKIKELFLYQ
jgi:hypothetical protein